jgi:Zn-dependent protease
MLSEGHVRNFGLRVGRVFGIDVWFHWTLLIIVGLELINRLLPREVQLDVHPVAYWCVYVLGLLVSLLLHEFGHCYAAYRQGGSAERVVLWPLGGLATCDAPQQPRPQFWVTAGGPLATAALAVFAALVCVLAGWRLLPFGGESFAFHRLFFQYLFLWNIFLLVLNLLPCYPLDGGRMLQSFLWDRFESYGEASLLTLRVSRVTAILALVAGGAILLMNFTSETFAYDHPLLSSFVWGFLLLAVLHFFYGARELRMRLEYGEEEDESVFGHDFSHGYTSLERPARRERRPSLFQRMRERSRKRARMRKFQQEREMRERLDQLLDKIHRESMDGLTREEKRFLERASRYLRKSEASKDA